MFKELVVAAGVSAALATGAARADVVLYGKIYAEFGTESFGTGVSEVEYTTLDDSQNLGRVGVWADHVVPPLIEAMNDRSPGVNSAITNALMELQPRVGPATGLMISNALFIDFLSPMRLPEE